RAVFGSSRRRRGLSLLNRPATLGRRFGFKRAAGTCSLGQDGLPETAGRPWRPKKSRAWPRLLLDKSRRKSKRNKVRTAMFSLKRAKARRHTGPARPDLLCSGFQGFCKHNRADRFRFLRAAAGPILVIAER